VENTGMDLGLWPEFLIFALIFGFITRIMYGTLCSIFGWIARPITDVVCQENFSKPTNLEPITKIEGTIEIGVEEDKEMLSESDWDTICAQAVEQAKQGNASARNWVTKNILEKESEKLVADELKTDVTIVSETVEALVSLGWKKGDATKEVKEAACAKEYKSVEDLLVFIHKKK